MRTGGGRDCASLAVGGLDIYPSVMRGRREGKGGELCERERDRGRIERDWREGNAIDGCMYMYI